jgi:N-carbamoylputrescine amidase
MSRKFLSVGLVQKRILPDAAQNLAQMITSVIEAKRSGADLIVLPELFHAPYFCQTHDPEAFELAESVAGPSVSALRAVAQQERVTIVVPFFEKRAAGLYHNSLVVVGPEGETLGHYRKAHIPDDPQFEEKYYFAPGEGDFEPIQTPAVLLGTLICYDQWFPEAARLMALGGAELLAYPTAIGWLAEEKDALGEEQLDAWETMQRSHAIANGVFVAAVNRVGEELTKGKRLEFWGNSFVCDPSGRVLGRLGTDEGVLVVECDLSAIEEQRRWWPFLRDRRPDAYAGLLERYRR